MRITAAPSREGGNPRGAVAIVASLFTVAFVIAMLPRDRGPTGGVVLAALPHGMMSALVTPVTAEQPAIRGVPPPAVHASGAPPLPQPTPLGENEGPGAEAIFTFSAPVADLPLLAARPWPAAGMPDAMMSPPAIEADGDHVISTAFRQTGAAVLFAFRKTGEGVKTAFTSIPW